MAIKPGDKEYPPYTVVAEYQTDHEYPVWWEYDPITLTHFVSYGAEAFDTTDSLAAAKAFSEYVHHAAQCAGKFDDTE